MKKKTKKKKKCVLKEVLNKMLSTDRTYIHTFMAMFNVMGEIASLSSVHQNRWRCQDLHIADAQYCLQDSAIAPR